MPWTQDESNRVTELSARVGDLERKIEFLLAHLQLTYIDPRDPNPAMQQVRDLIRKGNKIEAIKIYRQLTNAGLAEAKAAVDAIETGRL